jgi:hypothetical protein
LAIASVAVASPVFAKPVEPAPPPPTPFVEGSAPEGKALIYIYHPSDATADKAVMIFAKSGIIGAIPEGSYFAYVTEPGTIKLWLISIWSKELTIEAAAGSIYYVSAGFGISMSYVPNVFFDLKKRGDAINELAGFKQLAE